MPLAMCNVISANFVIFRPHQPPLYINTENALNNGTIFLVYYKDGNCNAKDSLVRESTDTLTGGGGYAYHSNLMF